MFGLPTTFALGLLNQPVATVYDDTDFDEDDDILPMEEDDEEDIDEFDDFDDDDDDDDDIFDDYDEDDEDLE